VEGRSHERIGRSRFKTTTADPPNKAIYQDVSNKRFRPNYNPNFSGDIPFTVPWIAISTSGADIETSKNWPLPAPLAHLLPNMMSSKAKVDKWKSCFVVSVSTQLSSGSMSCEDINPERPKGDLLASMDLEFAHMTRRKIQQEAHKSEHNLLRLVALCNTLEVYANRLRILHLAKTSATRVLNPNHNDCADASTFNQSKGDLSEGSNNNDDHGDTDSSEAGLNSDEHNSTPFADCSATSQVRRFIRMLRCKPLDSKSLLLFRNANISDESFYDDNKHNEYSKAYETNGLISLCGTFSKQETCLHLRPVPRDLYKIADLKF
jgi:hypothetical protein